MARCLKQASCAHVAMESTGVYWKPIYNIMSSDGFQMILANGKNVKNVPGRKSDLQDCQWIAQGLQDGLPKGSFITAEPIRELRDLMWHREKLVASRSSGVQHLKNALEDESIKMSSLPSDVVEVSGWDMLSELIRGETDTTKPAELSHGTLNSRRTQLADARERRLTDHHRFLLRQHVRQMRFLEQMIDECKQRIQEQLRLLQEYIPLLGPIPGINWTVAAGIGPEIGADMSQFPDEAHLVSWAGMCLGSNESARNHRSATTRHSNSWVRSLLVEAAPAASHKKGSYFREQYRRLCARRGKKGAMVAVGQDILTVVYHVMKKKILHQELGENFSDRINRDCVRRYHTKRPESFGYQLDLTLAAVVA
jgi:transposase